MRHSLVLKGMTTEAQRKQMFDEAHALGELIVALAKGENKKPAELVLACMDVIMHYIPTQDFDNMMLELSADAMIKIAEHKGWISLKELDSADPEKFFKSFLQNIFGEDITVKLMEVKQQDIHIPEDKKKWTN